MVLLDEVVQVLAGSHPHALRQLATVLQVGDRTMGGRISIQRDLSRNSLLHHGLTQKHLRGVHVTIPAQEEIDRPPRLIDRSIPLHPFAFDGDVGFVHPPKSSDGARVTFPALLKLGGIMMDPSQDRRVRQANAALRHHGHQIAGAQFETQVPADTQNHDLLIKMSALEQLVNRYESRHSSISFHPSDVCTRAVAQAALFESLLQTPEST